VFRSLASQLVSLRDESSAELWLSSGIAYSLKRPDSLWAFGQFSGATEDISNERKWGFPPTLSPTVQQGSETSALQGSGCSVLQALVM
jgi:hypothetical protein